MEYFIRVATSYRILIQDYIGIYNQYVHPIDIANEMEKLAICVIYKYLDNKLCLR